MNGKISSLPDNIREQLNTRLNNGEKRSAILTWLNSSPEVKAVIDERFGGEPVLKQNLYQWCKRGLRKWKLRKAALEFASEPPVAQPTNKSLASSLSEKLSEWAAIRFAAAAEGMVDLNEDPQAEMQHLREFCSDIAMLRRGDLSAGRLAVEQQRLTFQKYKNDTEKEQEFWEWTKRPDIHAKLYPHRDKEKLRREVDRMLTRQLLGIRDPDEIDEYADPACLI